MQWRELTSCYLPSESHRPWMSPKPPSALQHQIDRREVANHQVEIEVEALLNDLSGDQNCFARPLGISRLALRPFAVSLQNVLLDLLPPAERKAAWNKSICRLASAISS